MRKVRLFVTTAILSAIMAMTAMAGEWKQDETGWWYQNDDFSYPKSTWQRIDDKLYLFNSDGYMKTGWIHTVAGNWYYLNATGEMRYDDLTENGVTYHFNEDGICQNPSSGSGFDSDYRSILDQEELEARKRLLDQKPQEDAYEESIVYEHDVSSETAANRYGLADMDF